MSPDLVKNTKLLISRQNVKKRKKSTNHVVQAQEDDDTLEGLPAQLTTEVTDAVYDEFPTIGTNSPGFGTQPLTGLQWAISLVLGFFAIPLGALIRFIPDRFLGVIYAFLKKCTPLHKLASFRKDSIK
jgi:hypothetical protein